MKDAVLFWLAKPLADLAILGGVILLITAAGFVLYVYGATVRYVNDLASRWKGNS